MDKAQRAYKCYFISNLRQPLPQVHRNEFVFICEKYYNFGKEERHKLSPMWKDPIAWYLLPTTQSSRILTTNKNGFHATALLYLLVFIQILIQDIPLTVISTQTTRSWFILHRD